MPYTESVYYSQFLYINDGALFLAIRYKGSSKKTHGYCFHRACILLGRVDFKEINTYGMVKCSSFIFFYVFIKHLEVLNKMWSPGDETKEWERRDTCPHEADIPED